MRPWLLAIAVLACGVGVAGGAPKPGGRVIVKDAAVIEILAPVEFEPDRATIKPVSLPVLDAVAATLGDNPDLLLVEVQSHTDDRGDAKHNMTLSQARADALVHYLVTKGVAPTRLTAQGYGDTQPIDRHHTDAARAKNRRVAFLILKRSS